MAHGLFKFPTEKGISFLLIEIKQIVLSTTFFSIKGHLVVFHLFLLKSRKSFQFSVKRQVGDFLTNIFTNQLKVATSDGDEQTFNKAHI